jgi:hypothetical protein
VTEYEQALNDLLSTAIFFKEYGDETYRRGWNDSKRNTEYIIRKILNRRKEENERTVV